MLARLRLAALAALPVLALGSSDCYSTGDGSPPPLNSFYYPVGLQVSKGGSVLYVVNSDFDLQFNGGTVQSYDLLSIRQDVLKVIADPTDLTVHYVTPPAANAATACARGLPDTAPGFIPLGGTCAPPVDSTGYVRDSAVIGAFATDLVLSQTPTVAAPRSFDRLFVPVRGNASVTWLNVERDDPSTAPPADPASYGPFQLRCGQDTSRRCDAGHQAGSNPNEAGNSRHLTMPGEPFGLAVSDDGQTLVVTHQNDTKTSLFSTGLTLLDPAGGSAGADTNPAPAMQFVLDGVVNGGVGIASIPHDPDAFTAANPAATFPPAFLETSRDFAEVDLIRAYPDQVGSVPVGGADPNGSAASALRRPYLDREASFPLTAAAGGTDSRGIVIDSTPRIACKAKARAAGHTAPGDPVLLACAQKPARVFIASRSPDALLVGEIGSDESNDGHYDPDRLVIHTSVPLTVGPSNLYLAPVVDPDGAYALRVFVVCFDSATVAVYDPDAGQVENIIRVGAGPFAMAFDPFSLEDVATHAQVQTDGARGVKPVHRYRFGYLASFTNSYVQVLDLDDKDGLPTYEDIVFTLGQPTAPKGS